MKALAQPMNSPLQLDRYFLKELHFELNPGFDRALVPRKDIAMPEIHIGVVAIDQNPDNPRHWRFEVSLGLVDPKEGKFPYKVEATMVGYFTVSDKYPTERVERLARSNGPAVLYSSAREIVASITGCSPYSQLIIPLVTFLAPEKAIESGKPVKQIRASSSPKVRKKPTKRTAKKK